MLDSFQQVYDERYQAKYGYWRPIIEQSVTAYLKCGDLHEGFARVRCTDCKSRRAGIRCLLLQAEMHLPILPVQFLSVSVYQLLGWKQY